MTDIATVLRQTTPGGLVWADWQVSGGLLDSDPTLETAVLLSLFTEADAPDGVWIPEDEPRRRWWGQAYWPRVLARMGLDITALGDLQLGSLLWRWRRELQTEATRRGVIADTEACLDWMVRTGIARSIRVEGDWVETGLLVLPVEITAPDGTVNRYKPLWRLA